MEWTPGDRLNIEDMRGRSGFRAVPIGIGGVVVLAQARVRIQSCVSIHTDMRRTTTSPKHPSRRTARTRRTASTWVRKNMLMDQKKLDTVKRVLRAPTETQAVDAALDEIAFRHGVIEGLRALRRAGGLTDLFDER
jgi:hypothetical protein